ncbi:nucleolar transcription factor 1-B [Drosophila grimshawi]|uniref:nucleolar transcription factor 1-B n=1 Tax=Drosophila grimshawi TaxID=7222 RepID=UPI000C86F0C9|nr:nucleolar transcription factor 1-B [Drosophila grimshawi]
MYSRKKSKVLQTLEECVPPVDEDDAIDTMAQMMVQHPKSNPIEAGMRLGKIDKQHSLMHLESQVKLHAAMEHFDATPEQLDTAMPVSDKELNELVEVAASLNDDDEDEDDFEEDDDDDDDEDEDDVGELDEGGDADDDVNESLELYNLHDRPT